MYFYSEMAWIMDVVCGWTVDNWTLRTSIGPRLW